MIKPIIQIALDTTTTERAIALAEQAVEAGADWLEIGNPLVKFEGLKVVKEIRAVFPEKYIIVDLMIMAGPDKYIEALKAMGANNVTISGLAPNETIENAIQTCKRNQIESTIDLFNVSNLMEKAKRFEEMGADYLMVHFGVDQKKHLSVDPFLNQLKELSEVIEIPLSYASYEVSEANQAIKNGAQIIVQGEPLLSSENPSTTIKKFINKVKEGK